MDAHVESNRDPADGLRQSRAALADCQAHFTAFCRQRRLKLTPERRAILAAVAQADEHFDADWLLRRIRGRRVPVGRATLYRTLALLGEAGVIQQVLHGHKHMHYEYVFGRPRHDHIVDVDTGEIIEFRNDEVVRLRDAICRAHGYTAVGHRLQIQAVPPSAGRKG